jgi:hypothetical protein
MVATIREPFLMTPPVYGPTEAARALGISTSYVEKLQRQGIARPTVPFGASGRLIYSLADLRALAAAIGRDLDHDTGSEAA